MVAVGSSSFPVAGCVAVDRVCSCDTCREDFVPVLSSFRPEALMCGCLVFSGEPDMAEPGTDSVEVDPQASVITYSSADSDKFQSSCTDGYRPGGGNRKGHHTSRILHTMRGTRPTLPGRRNALRGCNQPPGQGNQSLKSKSRHTGSGFHEATGTEPFRKLPERKNCCSLPGNRNQSLRTVPVSRRSDADPIRNRSPASRQNTLQLNRGCW